MSLATDTELATVLTHCASVGGTVDMLDVLNTLAPAPDRKLDGRTREAKIRGKRWLSLSRGFGEAIARGHLVETHQTKTPAIYRITPNGLAWLADYQQTPDEVAS